MCGMTDSGPEPLVIRGKVVPRTLPESDHALADPHGIFVKTYNYRVAERDDARDLANRWMGSLSRHHRILWDVDRHLEVMKVAQNLLKKPEYVVAKLRTTLHGCRYLVDQWTFLRDLLDTTTFDGTYPAENHLVAVSLAGIPVQHRLIRVSYEPKPGSSIEEARTHVRGYIDAKIAELLALIEVHAADNRDQQELAIAKPDSFPDAVLSQSHRTIARCEREILTMWREFQQTVLPATEAKATVDSKPSNTVKKPVKTASQPKTYQRKPLATSDPIRIARLWKRNAKN